MDIRFGSNSLTSQVNGAKDYVEDIRRCDGGRKMVEQERSLKTAAN